MCPDCREPLVVYELEGVEVDHCLACGGTWLDPGELEFLTEIEGVRSSELSQAMAAVKSGEKSKRRCPRCRRRLRAVFLGQEKPVELDRCPRCRGLWLDRGEMDAVISLFAGGEEKAVSRFFADLYRGEREAKKEKPQGG